MAAREQTELELPPLRSELRAAVSRALGGKALAPSGNPGLVWNRYLRVWDDDRPAKQHGLGGGLDQFAKEYSTLRQSPGKVHATLLREHHARMKRLADSRDAQLLSPFVLGLGGAHATENGFNFDPLLGVPFIPGAALKGLCRASAEMLGEKPAAIEAVLGSRPAAFGETSRVSRPGSVIFHGAWPVRWPYLRTEILTPHNSAYQAQQTDTQPKRPLPVPSLFEEPEPIRFLAVEPRDDHENLRFRFYLGGRSEASDPALAWKWLLLGLDLLGIGGKTAAGYGRMRDGRLRDIVAEETQLPPPPLEEPPSSIVVIYTHPIQGRPVFVRTTEVLRDVGVRLSGDPIVGIRETQTWDEALAKTRELVAEVSRRLKNVNATVEQPRGVDVAALAPQPHLIALGRLLREGLDVFTHLKSRETPWGWQSAASDAALPNLVSPTTSKGTPAIVLSISGVIDPASLPRDGAPWRVWTVQLEAPAVDAIRTLAQRDKFVSAVRQALSEITATGARRVAVFPAMPAALAVEFGRASTISAFPSLDVYDRSSGEWQGPFPIP